MLRWKPENPQTNLQNSKDGRFQTLLYLIICNVWTKCMYKTWDYQSSSYGTVVRKEKGNGGSLNVGWQEKHSNALLAKIKVIKL